MGHPPSGAAAVDAAGALETIHAWAATAAGSEFFAGGVALGLVGLAAALGRAAARALGGLVSRRLWTRLTLDNRAPAYRHLCLWLEATAVLDRVRQVRLTDGHWSAGTRGYAPAPGRYWFVAAGRLCRLDRRLDHRARVGNGQRPLEVLEVGVLFGGLPLLLGWIGEGARLAALRDRTGPVLHVLRDGYWEEIGPLPPRTIDSLAVEGDRARQVLEDMRRFYGGGEWYAARGVPWRRGYLFHGPPGTGKSSLIRALASELRLDIATLDLGRATLTDDALREAMLGAPKGCLVALEDVDAVFSQREAGERKGGVSFSGLLNAIDGVGAQEGRALVMTTNHAERLDPALVRPGRADVHVEMGLVGAATARGLFERFFPGEAALAGAFEQALGSARLSPAAIQGWLLAARDDPGLAATARGLAPGGGGAEARFGVDRSGQFA